MLRQEKDIIFLSGNPNVEVTEGILHLYKTDSPISLEDDKLPTLLCLLSVPAHILLRDLFSFLESFREKIDEIKIVRDGKPNSYMAFIKFLTTGDARDFYRNFNNTRFNELEPDVCHMTFISHVEAISSAVGAMFPVRGMVELPSCPVCLERLDEPVHGILTTVLCNHSFHECCLSQMSETTCPVCRYLQSPEVVGDSVCAECDLRENLWICLICGNVGCGRYGQKHAHGHFEATGHIFALEVGKNLVWDYVGDSYVHRVVMNHDDGKLVQIGPASETGDKKLDAMSMELSAVLTSQLESQRFFFESQMDKMTTTFEDRMRSMESRLECAERGKSEADAKLAELSKENATQARKLEQLSALSKKLREELRDERAIAQSTVSSQSGWEERALAAEAKVAELSDELKDLMLNMEFRDKLKEMQEEEQIGESEIASASIGVTKRKGRRKRK